MTIFIKEIELDDILKPYDIDKPLTKLEVALLNQLEFASLSLIDIPKIEQWANKAYQQQDYLTAKTAFELMLRACIFQGENKDNFDVLDSLSGIAACSLKLGHLKQALPFYQFVYDTRSSAWGEQEVDTINSLEQFAICLSQLGRFKEALPFYKKIYEFRQLLLGTENQDTLGTLDNLANCLVNLGQIQEALPLFQQVYNTRQKLFGSKHLHTLQSFNNLPRCLFHLGRIGEAKTLWQQAYQNSQELFGTEHPDTLICLNNLAACMDRLGQNQEALPLHQQAYHTRKTLLGSLHPDTLYSLDNLAVSLSRLERFKEALPLFEQVYQNRLTVLGLQHHETLNSLNNFGSCLYDLGQFELALQSFQKAYEIRKTVLGEQDLDTLMSLYKLTTCLDDDEHLEKIVSFLKQISNLLVTTPMQYGKWTHITAMVANKIGRLAPLDITNTDWVKQLRPLSRAFIEALDLQAESFLQEARINFAQFHSAYLELCLDEQNQIIPEILAAIQGRKIAAFFLDELEQSTTQLIGKSFQGFFEIRSKLRQQSLIYNQKKLKDYQVLFDEYHSLRLELAKTTAFVNPTIDLEKLQANLPAQEAILLLIDLTSLSIKWMDEFEQIAFFITPNNYHLIPLVEISQFATQTLNYDLTSLRETVEKNLWQPFNDKLKGINHLHIVTHGKLHILPYELGLPKGIKFNNYPGLVFYQQLRHQRSSPKKIKPSAEALLGVHVEENQEQPIPLVKAEKQMIEAIWKNAIEPLNIEQAKVEFLHLAGHGFQELDDPANAKLLIAPDKFLNLQAILQSPLRPRVVFLSACVVGRISEDIDGEPLGLVSAFLMRGAEYVIASLIPVPDFYMPLLAVLFHQAWQQGYNPDTALAEAKRRLKQGEWYENTETLVRDSYYPVLIRIFKNIAKTRNRKIWQDLQKNWPIPAKYQRRGGAKINNLLSKLRKNEYCNQLVDDIIDYMFSHKAELDMGEFYSWVRGFGYVKK